MIVLIILVICVFVSIVSAFYKVEANNNFQNIIVDNQNPSKSMSVLAISGFYCPDEKTLCPNALLVRF